MKFCYNCKKMTSGQPLFCQFCARSFDTKYCPRLHPNPRSARACSQCGSTELTIPQPKVPFFLAPLLWVLTILPGLILWLGTVAFLFVFVYVVINDQQLMLQFMLLGLVIALLWLLYFQLPGFLRKGIEKRIFKRVKTDKRNGS